MKHCYGNLLEEVQTGIILQQVNCRGVMRSGIAKSIKEKWPIVEEQYLEIFTHLSLPEAHRLLGEFQLIEVAPQRYVVNIFGQNFYGRDGARYTSYDALDRALFSLANTIAKDVRLSFLSIHHPLIGCGLGGGNWDIVKAIIEANLGSDTTLWQLPE